jgi:hypothetical protein
MPSFPQRLYTLVCLCITVVSTDCVRHIPPVEPPTIPMRTYVDLQPGWRVRVVTPVLKSGKYVSDFKGIPSSGGAIELSAGSDFVGYETSYYRVSPAAQSGVSIEFVSSTVTIEGHESRKSWPIVRLFQMPPTDRHVRLLFLTRVSSADHNQAILAAKELNELDRLTELVEVDPATNCRAPSDIEYCEWVPEGIAVRAEKPDPAHRKNWISTP